MTSPADSAPDPEALLAATCAAWPEIARCGPFSLRRGGLSGGLMACAEEPLPDAGLPEAIAAAVARMAETGQAPRFRLGAGQEGLDDALARAGLRSSAAGRIHVAPVAGLNVAPPPLTGFAVWPPLAIQQQIWAGGGATDAGFCALEASAQEGPCTAILGRLRHRAAGALLVARRGEIAVIEALTVRPEHRRAKVARHMLATAAVWAASNGAVWIAAAVGDEDAAGQALAASLAMTPVAAYHHRVAG